MLDAIKALKDKQKEARQVKKQISKDLRNAERRRQRLKRRAKALSDADLVAVMALRTHEKALGRKDGIEAADSADDSESLCDESVASPSTARSTGVATSPASVAKKKKSTL